MGSPWNPHSGRVLYPFSLFTPPSPILSPISCLSSRCLVTETMPPQLKERESGLEKDDVEEKDESSCCWLAGGGGVSSVERPRRVQPFTADTTSTVATTTGNSGLTCFPKSASNGSLYGRRAILCTMRQDIDLLSYRHCLKQKSGIFYYS